MPTIRIVDVVDEPTFALLPPCADPAFDHRSCDYWEDADRGSKARAGVGLGRPARPPPRRPRNPFGEPRRRRPGVQPVRARRRRPGVQPVPGRRRPLADNPFAPKRRSPAAGGAATPAQARPPAPRPGDLRELRQGAARRRPGGRLRAVRAAVRVPAGARVSASCTRSCPTRRCRRSSPASRRRRRRAGRARAIARRPRSATTCRTAALRPSRPTRSAAPRPTQRARPRPNSGSEPASRSRSTTTASR